MDLKPNTHYTLHCDATEDQARFQLIDLATQQVAASTDEVTVFLRPSPSPAEPVVVPVLIPAHR
jgi:hypothetical protein